VRDAGVICHLARVKGCGPGEDWVLFERLQSTAAAFVIGRSEQVLFRQRG
jgi:hypothetical protein